MSKINILELLKTRTIFYDGATGTYLQQNGLKAGAMPELMNIDSPEIIVEMHKGFINAGSDVLLTNTFGANGLKFEKDKLKEIITAAVNHTKTAIEQCNQYTNGRPIYISYDMGPTGKLLKPMGDLDFEKAYELFKEQVLIAVENGVDLFTIETMTDLYEIKAAILAVKENSSLPLFATTAYDTDGKLLTGADTKTTVATIEALGVDALGLNCGMGPYQVEPIVDEILKYSSIPVMIKPNAGLPRVENGQQVYDINEEQFAAKMLDICQKGATILGGCCGTTSKHIETMVALCKDIKPKAIEEKPYTIVTSYAKSVELTGDPVIVGERINPTGKSKFKQALKDNNMDYILGEAIVQQEAGAHILDVNVGLPDIVEDEMMKRVVFEVQSIITLPLQIDTSDIRTLESGLRVYNGKAMVNSVNGKAESMEAVFPLVKKYGGVLVGLTLDESGIPNTAEERYSIAKKIVDTAKKYGISKRDIVIDPLAMTISSDKEGANVTLEALRMIRERLGVNTILGVSNISFGLPFRENINSNFFTLAMHSGLTSAIINPSSKAMMNAYYSYRAIAGLDDNCLAYIENNSNVETAPVKNVAAADITLGYIVERGLKEQAHDKTLEMLKTKTPLEVIDEMLMPALDNVGSGFEKVTLFLPQLLMSAETAKIAFEVVKDKLAKDGANQEKKGTIILATVKGDIHDIGKNIVKVILENYGYEIIDLGKDVDPELIVSTMKERNVKLVGLSALMTTTVVSMEETIKLIRKENLGTKVMVGGAVLTEDYAKKIDADHYGKDALSSANYSNTIFDA